MAHPHPLVLHRHTHADFFVLRRFLRARSYDLNQATAMWMNNVEFKKEFQVDTILKDFEFQERAPFLESFPQGYHKCDKMVRAWLTAVH